MQNAAGSAAIQRHARAARCGPGPRLPQDGDPSSAARKPRSWTSPFHPLVMLRDFQGPVVALGCGFESARPKLLGRVSGCARRDKSQRPARAPTAGTSPHHSVIAGCRAARIAGLVGVTVHDQRRSARSMPRQPTAVPCLASPQRISPPAADVGRHGHAARAGDRCKTHRGCGEITRLGKLRFGAATAGLR